MVNLEIYPEGGWKKLIATNILSSDIWHRNCNVGNWDAGWSCQNPPMESGTVYRTTDRHLGNAVYKKMDSSGVIWWSTDQVNWKREVQRYGGPTIQSVSQILYVSPSGSDTNGDGSESNPFATIQHAIDLAPNLFYNPSGGSSFIIRLMDGTYNENLILIRHLKGWSENYFGIESVNEKGATINGFIRLYDCTNFFIRKVKIAKEISLTGSTNISISDCDIIKSDYSSAGIVSFGSILNIYKTSISNRESAVIALGCSVISCFKLSGSGNNIAYNVGNTNGSAAIVMYNESTIEATTLEIKRYGGQIFT